MTKKSRSKKSVGTEQEIDVQEMKELSPEELEELKSRIAATPAADTATDSIAGDDVPAAQEERRVVADRRHPEEVLDELETANQAAAGSTPAEEDDTEDEAEDVASENFIEKDLFMIDRANCMRCLHLFPGAEAIGGKVGESFKPHTKCHWSQGNTNCPARRGRIVLGLNIEEITQEYLDALKSNDAGTIMEVMDKIHSRDAVVQKLAFSAIKEASKIG